MNANLYNDLVEFATAMDRNISWFVRISLKQFVAEHREAMRHDPVQFSFDLTRLDVAGDAMTEARKSFQDIAGKRFTVPAAFKAKAILNCLVFERGTRSFGVRLVEAGIDDYRDLEGMTVDEIVSRVPTTRSNLDKVLHYFRGAGSRLTYGRSTSSLITRLHPPASLETGAQHAFARSR